jgi:nucleotide-binding universal stress UspA family protein
VLSVLTDSLADERSNTAAERLQTIVVPLDGSALAQLAVPFASALARARPSRLVLVRATFWLDPAVASHPESHVLAVAQERTDRNAAREALSQVQTTLRDDGLDTETVVLGGPPAQVILEAAANYRADLIVMTTHGESGFQRLMFGSVAEDVLRRAPMPVLLVPRTGTASWPASQPPSVLILLDGSDLAERVLAPAGAVAAALGARIRLLRILEPPPVSTYAHMPNLAVSLRNQERDLDRQYLDGLRARLPDGLASVETQAVLRHAPASAIHRIAVAEQFDLVALASHGRGGLSRLLLGSVAAELVQGATTPLLIIGPTCIESSLRSISVHGN